MSYKHELTSFLLPKIANRTTAHIQTFCFSFSQVWEAW